MAAAKAYLCPACGRHASTAGRCPSDGTDVLAIDDPLLGTDIAGYRVAARIGAGGMGTVYKAILPSIGSHVAIKVLSEAFARAPDMTERFISEAKIANLVRHDGLVNVLSLGVLPDGRPYQVMEYLHGASLSDVLRQRGRLPIGTACELIVEALRALSPMHARGIVHRDLKPSNLYITVAGHAKVIDFGIAKVTTERGLTRTGQAVGTPQYMAPEQLDGDGIDARADLYAMGIVLFEALSAQSPFPGRVVEALATRESLPRLRHRGIDIPDELDDLLEKATAHAPEDRFASADAMADALDAIVQHLPRAQFGAPLSGVVIRASTPALAAAAAPSASAPTAIERPTSAPRSQSADAAPPTVPLSGPPVSPSTPSTPHSVPDRLGRYEVRGVLGTGGAGLVLDGFDPQIGRRVALKVLPSGDTRDTLRAEAQAMARVVHPGVVTVFDLGEHDGRLFLAMEHVEGVDLARWLAARPRSWREIVDMFVAAGHGLGAAHAVGVVHRDFKPANVVLGADQRPRVADFGIAGGLGKASSAAGTAAYMAPEQLDGGLALPASDQFAFCAALWEALHGELPFAGADATALAVAARRGVRRPSTRSDLPPALIDALARGLAPTPQQRYASMNELLAAITAALATPARSTRRGVWLAGGAFVALGTIAVFVIGGLPGSRATPSAATGPGSGSSSPPSSIATAPPDGSAAPDAVIAAPDGTLVQAAGERPDAGLASRPTSAKSGKPSLALRPCFCIRERDPVRGFMSRSNICRARERIDPTCRCYSADGDLRAAALCKGQPVGEGDTCDQYLDDSDFRGRGLKSGDACTGFRLQAGQVITASGTLASCSYCRTNVWQTSEEPGSSCTGVESHTGDTITGRLFCD